LNGYRATENRGKWKRADAEEAHNQWFPVVTGRGLGVSSPLLKSKADALIRRLDHRATDGCLDGWKCVFKIKLEKAHSWTVEVHKTCHTCFRNCVQMTCKMLIKEVCFIMQHRTAH
jgi:hypothetical protein